jgi:hypothetical protein
LGAELWQIAKESVTPSQDSEDEAYVDSGVIRASRSIDYGYFAAVVVPKQDFHVLDVGGPIAQITITGVAAKTLCNVAKNSLLELMKVDGAWHTPSNKVSFA